MKKNFENGITLIELCIYSIVMLIILGMLTSITFFYHRNIGIFYNNTGFIVEFEKFNAYFSNDVKKNKSCYISDNGKKIIFDDGNTYEYNIEEYAVYRNNVKIASNVIAFNVVKENISSGGINKEKLNTQIYIGSDSAISFKINIGYILKYW